MAELMRNCCDLPIVDALAGLVNRGCSRSAGRLVFFMGRPRLLGSMTMRGILLLMISVCIVSSGCSRGSGGDPETDPLDLYEAVVRWELRERAGSRKMPGGWALHVAIEKGDPNARFLERF